MKIVFLYSLRWLISIQITIVNSEHMYKTNIWGKLKVTIVNSENMYKTNIWETESQNSMEKPEGKTCFIILVKILWEWLAKRNGWSWLSKGVYFLCCREKKKKGQRGEAMSRKVSTCCWEEKRKMCEDFAGHTWRPILDHCVILFF